MTPGDFRKNSRFTRNIAETNALAPNVDQIRIDAATFVM